MTKKYYINKYYKTFYERKYINYDDEKILKILKNYDTKRHNFVLDTKVFLLLTQKMAKLLAGYFDEYLDFVIENFENYPFDTKEEIMNNAIEYTQQIQKILFEEDEIYKKITEICNKYKKDYPWFITSDKMTEKERFYDMRC